MNRVCPECHKIYTTYPCKLKKGWQQYCSKLCSSLARGTKVRRICLVCGKNFIVQRMAIINSGAKYCCYPCMWKGRKGKKYPSMQGKNAPNWKGGIQFEPYPFEFNDELKEKIRKRDNYECRICRLQDEEHILIYNYNLVIHHIDYKKENCEDTNLISLCVQCNSRVNYNREYWSYKLNEIIGQLLTQKGGL
jgi:hypothetical protein